MKFVVSPVGTSLLTNFANDQERLVLKQNANLKDRDRIPPSDLSQLDRLIDRARSCLLELEPREATSCSAEINGIFNFYEGTFVQHNGDIHLLIATDTFLGFATASIVASFLKEIGFRDVRIKPIPGLQTQNFDDFQIALKRLAELCEGEIKLYRGAYRVIFNLTGGFKSVQGFLQTLANFYADEVIYIFEGSNNLMRIPRLPVRLDTDGTFGDSDESIYAARRLSLDLEICQEDAAALPEAFIIKVDNQFDFSGFGKMLWNQARPDLYREKLYAPPTPRARFGPEFTDSVKDLRLEHKRIQEINSKLDDLARFLEKGQNLQSFDFKPLRGNQMWPSTHEFDAWHDQDAKRIYCHYDGEGPDKILVLDKLGRALH